MTVYFAAALLVSLVALLRFGETAVCVQCGGRNAHRRTCPFRKD